jgi:hypothetical protein
MHSRKSTRDLQISELFFALSAFENARIVRKLLLFNRSGNKLTFVAVALVSPVIPIISIG